ncbi:hypothetical protein DFQ29_004212 [Apophysomyces sp. BC1021]|nr:hypothetical protein DFQ29_004212 [Apophysomyces sp. BC1021]
MSAFENQECYPQNRFSKLRVSASYVFMPQFTFRYVQVDGRLLNENGEEANDEEQEDQPDMMEVETLTDFNQCSKANCKVTELCQK